MERKISGVPLQTGKKFLKEFAESFRIMINPNPYLFFFGLMVCSETQGQFVGARRSESCIIVVTKIYIRRAEFRLATTNCPLMGLNADMKAKTVRIREEGSPCYPTEIE